MAPLWSDWTRRLCLALCLALTVACTASATQQRLMIVRAVQTGHPAQHVPQMLMTLHDRDPELPTLEAVVLPTLVVILSTWEQCAPKINFLPRAIVAIYAPIFRDPRGPPVLL